MASITRVFQTSLCLFINVISSFQMSPLFPYLVNSFTSLQNASLKHFTVSSNGSVYIGAVEYLYHLSPNFDIQSQDDFQKNGDRNVNKLLEIIPSVNELISCGTGLGGTCQFRSLNNVSEDVRYLSPLRLNIVAEEDSTVGLVVKEISGRISLHIAQTVRQEDRLHRRPVSSVCLYTKNQSRCGNDDRKTRYISYVKDDFIIRYVSVFSYKGFTYYIASQREDATNFESPIVTKMSRVCHNDTSTNLSGFTEITLECNGTDNSPYSIVQSAVEVNGTLYAVFIKNTPEDGPDFKGTNQSALCMYEMETLITEFEESMVNCSCNSGSGSHSTYLSNSACLQQVHCGILPKFTCFIPPSIGSTYPQRLSSLGGLPGLLVFETNDASFSSVTVTKINQPLSKVVAFIGTKEGTLLKVHFNAGLLTSCVLYEILEMGHPVLSDTWINPRGETAMFLTEKQLLEIKVANCGLYETCEECIKPGLEGGDPYCGWCTLEKRCARYEECRSSDTQYRWLWFNETECSGITDITPSSISTNLHSQTVIVTVSNVPVPNGFNYICHFGPAFTFFATYNDEMISCISPGIPEIPKIPDGDDAVEVFFAISSSQFNIPFVATTYTFFDCSRIERCIDCVSLWECDWCVDELRCTYRLDNKCNNITGSQNDAYGFCPFLVPGSAIIPSGVHKNIDVTVKNLNLTSRLSEREYQCVVKSEETMQIAFISDATLVVGPYEDYNLTCSNNQYSYSMRKREMQMVLSLRWRGTDVYLDGSFMVTFYKCDIDRPDCSRCLSNITSRPELECGWCNAPQGYCAVEESCSFNLFRQCSTPPKILSVSPTSSPVEGGTIIQINGTDLGQRFSDIVNVSLAGVLCQHQNFSDNYQVGASLICEAGISSYPTRGKVSVILVHNNIPTEYEEDQFSYNDPKIFSFHPMVGPQAGGTLIKINGTHFQTGRDVRVEVGETSCTVVELSSSTILCRNKGLTKLESSTGNQTVSITFDGHRRFATERFTYHLDPIVAEITPSRAIKSGGNLLSVTGERFYLIQNPKIRFTVDGNSAERDCIHYNGMEMICTSPSIRELVQQRKRSVVEDVEGYVAVGFIMDGVTNLLHWSQNNSVAFQYFRDPQYETFDVRDHPNTANHLLTLRGVGLGLASSKEDVTVYIGNELCEVKVLEATTLICQLPTEQPGPGDIYGDRMSKKLPFVIVKHANLEFAIGYIRYVGSNNPSLIVIVTVMVVLAALIVIVVFFTILHIWRKNTRKIRDLEMEVQTAEESIHANLIVLFATLKSTMLDFEIAIREQTEIPLLEKRHYLMNMMFHGLKVFPSVLSTQKTFNDPNQAIAMEESSGILYHKHFLKFFITTLDKSTSLSSVKKANVASLLAICLLKNGKLELFTDLLMDLMQEQIKECKNKEKLHHLFNSSDTMVSKLTSNWASIFLYGFLKQQAAHEVYQLYEAIKHVCEMGPIDAISGKSQFSLNDEQILQTHIKFKEVKLDFVTKSGQHKPVKVLDVNSITQVKDTIISQNYRYLPYSQRPSPFALDLICNTGESGLMVLRDDESPSSSLEKGWRKINALTDFHVPSDSSFELIPKEEFAKDFERQPENADEIVHHTYHGENRDYFEIFPEHSREKSDNMNMKELARKLPYDSNFGKMIKDKGPVLSTNESVGKGDSSDYSHRLYGSDDPQYEDIAREMYNVAKNGDLQQFNGMGYDVKMTKGVKLWHLLKEDKGDTGDYEDVPDPRLRNDVEDPVLSFLPVTVNNVQKFVDNLINTMFASYTRTEVPISIKLMFQFFDREAKKAGKPELAKDWKNNFLPLDFWITIIANPHFVLDVGKYTYTQESLKIIAQVIKDTCIGSDKTHKDQAVSPSRLLYSHFLKGYTSKLDKYYFFINNLELVESEDFRRECVKVEQEFQETFDLMSTQQELFSFMADHEKELTEALEEDKFCKELSYATALRRLTEKMNY